MENERFCEPLRPLYYCQPRMPSSPLAVRDSCTVNFCIFLITLSLPSFLIVYLHLPKDRYKSRTAQKSMQKLLIIKFLTIYSFYKPVFSQLENIRCVCVGEATERQYAGNWTKDMIFISDTLFILICFFHFHFRCGG